MAGKKRPTRHAAKARSGRGGSRRRPSRAANSTARKAAKRKAARAKRAVKRMVKRPTKRRTKPSIKPRKVARASRKSGGAKRAVRRPIPKSPAPPVGPATLGRERKRLPDAERLEPGVATSLRDDRLIASARAGHDELQSMLNKHTETSPALAGGDIDAKWEDAYAVGDEAPGGDNPTPGQDRVDDIGKALGVNYRQDEELKGGDEITERDKHRWELDPASSDDWPHGSEEARGDDEEDK